MAAGLRRLSTCGLAIATVLVWAFAPAAATSVAKKAPVPLARLEVQERQVATASAQATRFKPAKDKLPLGEGHRVETDGLGRAQIDYRDGSLARLDGSSLLTIVELSDEAGRRRTVTSMQGGRSWHRVEKLTGSGSVYEVRAGGVSAAGLDAAFLVECSARLAECAEARFLAVDGSIELTGASGTPLRLAPGQAVLVTAGTAGTVGQLTSAQVSTVPFVQENLAADAATSSASSSTTTTRRGPSGSTARAAGPCDLLAPADLDAALGATFGPGTASGTSAAPRCDFVAGPVGVTVVLYTGDLAKTAFAALRQRGDAYTKEAGASGVEVDYYPPGAHPELVSAFDGTRSFYISYFDSGGSKGAHRAGLLALAGIAQRKLG